MMMLHDDIASVVALWPSAVF